MIGYIIYILAHFFTQFNVAEVPVFKPTPIQTDSLAKYVYLSFDDGPLPGTGNCVGVGLKTGTSATLNCVKK